MLCYVVTYLVVPYRVVLSCDVLCVALRCALLQCVAPRCVVLHRVLMCCSFEVCRALPRRVVYYLALLCCVVVGPASEFLFVFGSDASTSMNKSMQEWMNE